MTDQMDTEGGRFALDQEQTNLWLQMHYESGQAPMVLIRGHLKEEGFRLDPRAAHNVGVWNRLEDSYFRKYQGAPERSHWNAFRDAAKRLGYSVAREAPEAQERQERYLPEARSRMVAGPRLRWMAVHPHGVATAPRYPGDVGVDLAAVEDTPVFPGAVTYIRTGVAFAIPTGHWIYLLGRSSLAAKLGLACIPGVIDEGYRGEMLAGVYTINQDLDHEIWVKEGTRVAQAILMPGIVPALDRVEELPPSPRGTNGFGSTGGH